MSRITRVVVAITVGNLASVCAMYVLNWLVALPINDGGMQIGVAFQQAVVENRELWLVTVLVTLLGGACGGFIAAQLVDKWRVFVGTAATIVPALLLIRHYYTLAFPRPSTTSFLIPLLLLLAGAIGALAKSALARNRGERST